MLCRFADRSPSEPPTSRLLLRLQSQPPAAVPPGTLAFLSLCLNLRFSRILGTAIETAPPGFLPLALRCSLQLSSEILNSSAPWAILLSKLLQFPCVNAVQMRVLRKSGISFNSSELWANTHEAPYLHLPSL